MSNDEGVIEENLSVDDIFSLLDIGEVAVFGDNAFPVSALSMVKEPDWKDGLRRFINYAWSYVAETRFDIVVCRPRELLDNYRVNVGQKRRIERRAGRDPDALLYVAVSRRSKKAGNWSALLAFPPLYFVEYLDSAIVFDSSVGFNIKSDAAKKFLDACERIQTEWRQQFFKHSLEDLQSEASPNLFFPDQIVQVGVELSEFLLATPTENQSQKGEEWLHSMSVKLENIFKWLKKDY